MQFIVKMNIQMKSEAFLLGMLDDCIGEDFKMLFLYMMTSARIYGIYGNSIGQRLVDEGFRTSRNGYIYDCN